MPFKFFVSSSKALSLLELVLAISLLGVTLLAIANLDSFVANYFKYFDRSPQVYNNLAYILDFMAKEFLKNITTVTLEGNYLNFTYNGVNSSFEFKDKNSECSLFYKNLTSGSGICLSKFINSSTVTYEPGYVNITLVGCYNLSNTCSTPQNPQIEMRTRIRIPALITRN